LVVGTYDGKTVSKPLLRGTLADGTSLVALQNKIAAILGASSIEDVDWVTSGTTNVYV